MGRRAASLLVFAVGTGCFSSVPFEAWRTCNVSSDCPVDFYCAERRCRACPACAAGERCLDGQCLPTNCGGVTCPAGEACVDGRCVVPGCTDVTCLDGRCVIGTCWPTRCGATDCPTDQVCDDGVCRPFRCAGVDCAPGSVCQDGSCVACGTEACTGDTDDDCDGLTDCADPDCQSQPCGAGQACSDRTCRSGTCQEVAKAQGVPCRAAAGACDRDESCDGTGFACPADAFAAAGVTCRAAVGACDLEERCDGTRAACPGDEVRSGGAPCRPSLGPCDPAEACDGTNPTCPADARLTTSDVCSFGSDLCEQDAYCDGMDAACPAKSAVVAGSVCRAATDLCDRAETCDGASPACPADGVRAVGEICRASRGACDPLELCDGAGKGCPPDAVLGPSDSCAAAVDLCERPAFCDGSSATCPANPPATAGTPCRAAADLCDVAETCDGTAHTCPTDRFATAGSPCGGVGTCDGVSAVCSVVVVPPAPTFVSTTPASPTNATTTPLVKGAASPTTTTVTLYSDAGCTAAIGTGTKASFEGAGLAATVAANATTTIYAVASDGASRRSPCVLLTTFVHDSQPPAAPTFGGTSPNPPTSPAFDVFGTASADTATVTLYRDSGCTAQVGSGTKATFEGAGVTATLSPNVQTTVYAKAFDAAGNASACTPLTTYQPVRSWTWIAGPSTSTTIGRAVTKGLADPGYYPGSRHKHMLFARSGQLWAFGGYGCTTANCSIGYLNDLWRFDGASWAWISGTAGSTNVNGVYGTKGVAAAANTPGARILGATAVDASGNLWLFGGWGYGASANKEGELNDLWKFDGASWTWVSGGTCSSGNCKSPDVEPLGVYGTKGVPAASNVPGGRDSGLGWVDAQGRFWLFGGTGCDASSCVTNTNALADVWRFDPATSLWTWIAGPTAANAAASYGTRGVTGPGNLPGGRYLTAGWPVAGGMQLFGGWGYDATGAKSDLGDLWRFDGTSFTWVGGSDRADQRTVPGTLGVAAPTNWPGSRDSAAYAGDGSGGAYLFGGNGCDTAGCSASMSNFLSDLWRWDGTSWTWIGGSSLAGEASSHGTRGVPASGNTPGGRARAAAAVDASGTLWLLGGEGRDSAGASGKLCDLWRYE